MAKAIDARILPSYRGWRNRGWEAILLPDFTEVIRLDPKSVDAYYCRGVAYRTQGNVFRAVADMAVAKKLEAARK